MTKLLVSVRSVEEAEAALSAGAALIDVKEPSRGSLGRADAATIAAVADFVRQRRPVSAALGELREAGPPFAVTGLSYVKWGLAGCGLDGGWRDSLAAAANGLRRNAPRCGFVAVAYADWQRAHSPPPAEVCAFAQELSCAAFLLDTCCKDGTTLLNWLSVSEIAGLCRLCRQAAIPVALAGSLGLGEVAVLLPAKPDWFAVRGSVCRGGRRGQELDPDAVRYWSKLLARSVRKAAVES